MIELDEKDIRSVAKSRFIRAHDKQLIIMVIGCIVAFIALDYATSQFKNFLHYLSIIPMIGLLVYFGWYLKSMKVSEEKLVKEWKK